MTVCRSESLAPSASTRLTAAARWRRQAYIISSSNGGSTSRRTSSPVRSREPVPRPASSSPSTYSLSVETCQSASRAIVCPTARVSRTAVSKSSVPDARPGAISSIASRSDCGERRRVAQGRGTRAPATTARATHAPRRHVSTSSTSGWAPRRGSRARGPRASGPSISRGGVGLGRVQLRSPAIGLRTAEGVPSSSAPSSLPNSRSVISSWSCSTRGTSCSTELPSSFATEMTSVPQPSSRSRMSRSYATSLIR